MDGSKGKNVLNEDNNKEGRSIHQLAPGKLMVDAQKTNKQTNLIMGGKIEKKMNSVEVVDWGDSEDEGLKISDLIQPGSEVLNIGPDHKLQVHNETDRKL